MEEEKEMGRMANAETLDKLAAHVEEAHRLAKKLIEVHEKPAEDNKMSLKQAIKIVEAEALKRYGEAEDVPDYLSQIGAVLCGGIRYRIEITDGKAEEQYARCGDTLVGVRIRVLPVGTNPGEQEPVEAETVSN